MVNNYVLGGKGMVTAYNHYKPEIPTSVTRH